MELTEIVSVEVEEVDESNTVTGLSVALMPDRLTTAVMLMLPEKPLIPDSVIDEVPEKPA